jgi:hypothetical protein
MVSALPCIDCRVLLRVIAAGTAWGATLSLGFLVIALVRCGVPSPSDIAMVTAMCVGTGMLTIGPLAAFLRTRVNR